MSPELAVVFITEPSGEPCIILSHQLYPLHLGTPVYGVWGVFRTLVKEGLGSGWE